MLPVCQAGRRTAALGQHSRRGRRDRGGKRQEEGGERGARGGTVLYRPLVGSSAVLLISPEIASGTGTYVSTGRTPVRRQRASIASAARTTRAAQH